MVALFSGLVSLVLSALAWFASLFGFSFALRLIAVASLLAVITIYAQSLNELISGLQVHIPEHVNIAASWFLPSTTGVYIQIIVTANIALFVYKLNWKIISLKSSAK